MSLPTNFKIPDEYFKAAVEFLTKYSWIYQHANTCFVKANVLNQMPADFQNYFIGISNEELNQFPMLNTHDFTTPYESLNRFLAKLKELTPSASFAELNTLETNLSVNFQGKSFQKMNPKKLHEIERLAYLINEQMQSSNEVLIDFGAGLGYLSEMLYYHNKNCRIIGLEADNYRVEAAQKRQTEYMPNTKDTICYKQAYITMDSSDFIENSVEELVNLNQLTRIVVKPQMCIIGLHACADLTITSIKLFLTMSSVRKLVIMPCCYHKLKMLDSGEFVNFPLSDSLRPKVKHSVDANHIEHSEYFNRPFLRLACQQTSARWYNLTEEEHLRHGYEMFWRAAAECIIGNNEVVVKRKGVGREVFQDLSSFEQFCNTFMLKSKDTSFELSWNDKHELRFIEIYEKYGKNGPKLAEGLTCLQTSIQKLCENIVLYDRLCFMFEFAAKCNLQIQARYQKLLDEQLSPRCFVLIAEKL